MAFRCSAQTLHYVTIKVLTAISASTAFARRPFGVLPVYVTFFQRKTLNCVSRSACNTSLASTCLPSGRTDVCYSCASPHRLTT